MWCGCRYMRPEASRGQFSRNDAICTLVMTGSSTEFRDGFLVQSYPEHTKETQWNGDTQFSYFVFFHLRDSILSTFATFFFISLFFFFSAWMLRKWDRMILLKLYRYKENYVYRTITIIYNLVPCCVMSKHRLRGAMKPCLPLYVLIWCSSLVGWVRLG